MTEKTGRRSRGVTRRQALRTAVVGSVALTAAALGCAGGEKPVGAPTGGSSPKRGGIVSRQGGAGNADDTLGRTFDVHVEAPRTGQTLRLIYQGLLGYNLVTYELEPDLAQSWEQPSETEYLFRLAPGLKWHRKPPVDGREVEASDVVFSLNRARIDEPRFQNRSVIAMLDKVEAVDKSTVRVTTKGPDVTTLAALAADAILVLAPEVVERAGRFLTPDEAVGSGAFIMKDVQQGVTGEYVRNPDYFKPGLPYLDGVRTPFFQDEQSAFAAFLAGRLDIAQVPGTLVKRYVADQGPDFRPQWFEREIINVMTPQTLKKPFDDPRVTKALHLLADYDEFITAYAEVVFGRGGYGSIFGSALKEWDVSQEEYRRHLIWQQPKDAAIREALALLGAAGFTRENPLRFELAVLDVPSIRPGGELLHAQFRRNGQGVVQTSDLKLYDSPTRSRVAVQGQFEYAYWPVSGAIVEPGVFLNQLWRTGGSRNYGRQSDPKVDSMIDKQNVTFNPQERKALVQEIVRYMMDNSPAIASGVTSNLNAVNPRIRGFAPEAFMSGRQYQWIWLDS